jgi:ribonuclease PH
MPSRSGIMMSSTRASGSKSRVVCSASNPEDAARTSHPSMRRAIESRSVSICSSSTTSTRSAVPSGRVRAGEGAVAFMDLIVRFVL